MPQQAARLVRNPEFRGAFGAIQCSPAGFSWWVWWGNGRFLEKAMRIERANEAFSAWFYDIFVEI
jgi:hypothetical protein